MLNSDIKVLDGCIDAVADFFDRNPDVGIAGPKILNCDLTHQSSCRRYPTLWNNFTAASGLAKVFPKSRLFAAEHMVYFKGDREMDVDVLVGCFSALRREAFRRSGCWTRRTHMYGDDLDWCRRFKQGGWRVVFYPVPRPSITWARARQRRTPVRYAIMQQKSVLRYWIKYHGLAGRLGIGCLMFCNLVIRWCGACVKSVLRPASREQSRVKMRVSSALLRALLGGAPKADATARADAPRQGVMP